MRRSRATQLRKLEILTNPLRALERLPNVGASLGSRLPKFIGSNSTVSPHPYHLAHSEIDNSGVALDP
jgi:hypothetical protein